MDGHFLLRELKEKYHFSDDLLVRYLGISKEEIDKIIECGISYLNYESNILFEIENKIAFIYFSVVDSPDLKLTSFLNVLVDNQGISIDTLSSMANVDNEIIEKLYNNSVSGVSIEDRYKVMSIVMSLRFFLKELE